MPNQRLGCALRHRRRLHHDGRGISSGIPETRGAPLENQRRAMDTPRAQGYGAGPGRGCEPVPPTTVVPRYQSFPWYRRWCSNPACTSCSPSPWPRSLDDDDDVVVVVAIAATINTLCLSSKLPRKPNLTKSMRKDQHALPAAWRKLFPRAGMTARDNFLNLITPRLRN